MENSGSMAAQVVLSLGWRSDGVAMVVKTITLVPASRLTLSRDFQELTKVQ